MESLIARIETVVIRGNVRETEGMRYLRGWVRER